MIETNSEWDTKNAELAKKPIYVFEIGGQARVYSTHDLTAEGVTNPPADSKPWLKTPRGATQTIDVVQGSSSIGELECEVIDPDGSVRTLVGGTTLEGQTAKLSVGYPGLDWSDFVRLHTYVLYKIVPQAGYTAWMFRSRDRQMALKRTVYTHPENDQALSEANPWVFSGTPAEIVQAMYLFALHRDLADLDIDGIWALDSGAAALYKTVRPFRFQLVEPFEVKQFLETEIYRPCGLYCVIDNLGRITLRAFRPPPGGAQSVYTFDEDNVTTLPTIDRMEILNEIIWKIDDGGREIIYIEADSVSTFGRARQLTIESKGLRTVLGAQWWCQNASRRLFARFAGTPRALRGGAPVFTVEAFLMTLPVWTGDFVTLNHAMVPNLLTGGQGVNSIYEVIDRTPDYMNGRMQYKLLDTGLASVTAAYRWAPDARPFLIGSSPIF